jgi:uncharacterized protein (TIGR03083 family)
VAVDHRPLDLTPFLAPERAVLLDLLGALSDSDWQRATECPEWTVHGIALHILGDDLSLLARQRDAAPNGLFLFAQDRPGLTFRSLLDGFNDQWVVASRFISTELVIEMLRLVGEWSDTFYGNVGLDTIAREPVGFFASVNPSPYWQLIAREYIERFVHQSQIRRAIGAPELDGEIVTAAARTVAHAVAAWLRNYEPGVGSTIAIEFGAAGSWTWQREAGHWSVLDGVPVDPTARVTVAADRAVAMLSLGISEDQARGSITVSGDQAVANGALEIVAPLLSRRATLPP